MLFSLPVKDKIFSICFCLWRNEFHILLFVIKFTVAHDTGIWYCNINYRKFLWIHCLHHTELFQISLALYYHDNKIRRYLWKAQDIYFKYTLTITEKLTYSISNSCKHTICTKDGSTKYCALSIQRIINITNN